MTGAHPCFDGCEICQAALVAEWSGRLDRFCAELETKGFRIGARVSASASTYRRQLGDRDD